MSSSIRQQHGRTTTSHNKATKLSTFKPWRKGKSKNSGGAKGSLKHQLRGLERLLKKVDDADTERRNDLESKIASVQSEMAQRSRVDRERKNAVKSHKVRFLDRKRLARLEKGARRRLQEANAKHNNEGSSSAEKDLLKVALDQAFVAHFPHDEKYMPLFKKNERYVDGSRTLHRRAAIRERILKSLRDKSSEVKRMDWISSDQYALLPTSWSSEDEKAMFGILGKKPKGIPKRLAVVDERFPEKNNAPTINEETEDNPMTDSRVRDAESDEDDAYPLVSANKSPPPAGPEGNQELPAENVDKGDDTDSDSDSSDSSSDDSDSDDQETSKDHQMVPSSGNDNDHRPAAEHEGSTMEADKDENELDDFLVSNDDAPGQSSFSERTAQAAFPKDFFEADKSKGWKSQSKRYT